MSSPDAAQGAPPLTPGTMLFEYRIRRVLGTGGFGITYEAQDPLLDKVVAIKEYLPSELAVRAGNNSVEMRSEETREGFNWGRDEFLKEARVLARFNHPSLIHVYRFFEANNTAYFVMEYAEGQTLDAILMKEGLMSEAQIKQILLPILDGLKEVHRARVLHRDIKPSNMIARKDGSAVLIDFGSARQDVSSMTQSMMSVVTPGYAPVEQYAVDGHQGPWTDIYALGAVAYRAIVGKRPIESVGRLNTDTLVPATKLGAGKYSLNFLRAIDWALAVHPEDRPVGISDWRQALEGTLQVPVRDVRTGPRADLKVADPVEDGAESTQTISVGAAPAPAPVRGPVDVPEWSMMEDKPSASDQAAAAAVAAKAAQKVVRTHADPAGVWHRPLPPRVMLPPSAAAAPPPAPTPVSSPASAPAVVAAPSAGVAAPVAAPASTPAPAAAPPAGAPQPAPASAGPSSATAAVDAPAPAPAPSQAPAAGRPRIAIIVAVVAALIAAVVIVLVMSGGDDEATRASAATKARKTVKRVEEPKQAAPIVLSAKAGVAIASMSALSTFSDCDVCPSMVALPPGGFLMGSEAGGDASEQPAHRVTFETPFAAGAHEIRNREWQACVAAGGCPALASGEAPAGDLPVVNVTRAEAEQYAQWLSQVTQRNYRLPTEAEWEYAARADSTNPWFWGQSGPQCNFANGADLSSRELLGKEAPKVDCRDGHATPAPAGSFQPNDFGLHDTAGNVAEWQADCWRENYEGVEDGTAAEPATPCASYAVRGGSFRQPPPALRSAARQPRGADERADDLGFRVIAE